MGEHEHDPASVPPGTATTVRVSQGSQPTFGGVRVGVMVAGLHHGIPKARLLLRSDDDTRRLDVTEGESVDLLGRGTLTLDQVHPRATPDERDAVTLTARVDSGA